MKDRALVFQSDFGYTDGGVAAMYGVSLCIEPELKIFNLTHEIIPYNIFEASYRLFQVVEYWPGETVFVSIVDPGVGSNRNSVVVKTKGNQYVVTPNNGTLTHLKRFVGIEAVREIDTSIYLRKNSETSYTFHGRDLYANVGARLASGQISFEDVGRELNESNIVEVKIGNVEIGEGSVKGCIDVLDGRFGSIWTNITREDFLSLEVDYGDKVEVAISNGDLPVFKETIPYCRSFADVKENAKLVYMNSLYRMAVAINQGHFAKVHSIGTGLNWIIKFSKADGQ
jgi:Uncharacterized conserved protein